MGDLTRSVNVSFVSPTERLPLAWMNNYFFEDHHSSSDPETGYIGVVGVLVPVES